jgi:HipA-like protein
MTTNAVTPANSPEALGAAVLASRHKLFNPTPIGARGGRRCAFHRGVGGRQAHRALGKPAESVARIGWQLGSGRPDMARHLEVWLRGAHVGTLSQVDGRLSFAYAPGVTMPLSQSLPIRPEPYEDRATRPFFAGLLPEGGKRKQIAKTLQVSTQNDYALLDSLGGECAGTVTLLESGQKPQALHAPHEVRWLDHAHRSEQLLPQSIEGVVCNPIPALRQMFPMSGYGDIAGLDNLDRAAT